MYKKRLRAKKKAICGCSIEENQHQMEILIERTQHQIKQIQNGR